MPLPLLEWTAEMARALPDDGNRYEVLDGALHVTPAPRLRHQWALTDLFRRIDAFVERERLGRTMMSPTDIEYSPRRLVQPDLFVVPFAPGQPPREWTEARDLLLVSEVLSRGHRRVGDRPAGVLRRAAVGCSCGCRRAPPSSLVRHGSAVRRSPFDCPASAGARRPRCGRCLDGHDSLCRSSDSSVDAFHAQ